MKDAQCTRCKSYNTVYIETKKKGVLELNYYRCKDCGKVFLVIR